MTLATGSAAQVLLLLTREDGRAVSPVNRVRPALAAAAIRDLVSSGALVLVPGSRQPELRAGPAPADPTLAALAAACDGHTVRRAVGRTAVSTWSGAAVDLRTPLRSALVADGVLREEPHRTLGLVRTTRWVSVDGARRRALLDRVRSVLLAGATPDAGLAVVIGSVATTRLVPALLRGEGATREEQATARRRGDEIVAADPVLAAARYAYDQAASA